MSTNLKSLIGAQLGWTWQDRDGTATVTNSNRTVFRQDLQDGAEANQADAVWNSDNRVLAAGGSETLELDALEKCLFGDTIYVSLLTVKAILLVNRSTADDAYLTVGGAPGDTWIGPFGAASDTIRVMPGGALLLAAPRAGWDVEVGTADLRIAAPALGVTYDIAILGTTSAASESSSSSGT